MSDLHCHYCNLTIANGENRVRSKLPLRRGNNPEDYVHLHNRQRGDCWFKYLRDEVVKPKPTFDLIQLS